MQTSSYTALGTEVSLEILQFVEMAENAQGDDDGGV